MGALKSIFKLGKEIFKPTPSVQKAANAAKAARAAERKSRNKPSTQQQRKSLQDQTGKALIAASGTAFAGTAINAVSKDAEGPQKSRLKKKAQREHGQRQDLIATDKILNPGRIKEDQKVADKKAFIKANTPKPKKSKKADISSKAFQKFVSDTKTQDAKNSANEIRRINNGK